MGTTAAILERMETRGEWLRTDASSMVDLVTALKVRRDFPTLAEDAMLKAEQDLYEALQKVRLCISAYKAKPAERDPYIVGADHAA